MRRFALPRQSHLFPRYSHLLRTYKGLVVLRNLDINRTIWYQLGVRFKIIGRARKLCAEWIARNRQMPAGMRRFSSLAALAMLGAFACGATIVPRLSLEEMVVHSETIVTGRVIRTWATWDSQHQFIWTHNEIVVEDVVKGRHTDRVVVSEPGGVVDGLGMQIAGSPRYALGERVMVFLERMPNGYLRTTGMGQGKLSISHDGSVHLTQAGADLVGTGSGTGGTALQTLDAATAAEVRRRVVHLVQSATGSQP